MEDTSIFEVKILKGIYWLLSQSESLAFYKPNFSTGMGK